MRSEWVVLISTGNPGITHTEWIYSLAELRRVIEYYGMERLLIFGEGYES